jgi:hypothetical protein
MDLPEGIWAVVPPATTLRAHQCLASVLPLHSDHKALKLQGVQEVLSVRITDQAKRYQNNLVFS